MDSSMDGYWLGKLLFDANSDREQKLSKAFRADPDAVLARYPLSPRAAAAVREGNLRAIFEFGVHPLLVRMGYLSLFGPISTPDYRKALAGAVQAEY